MKTGKLIPPFVAFFVTATAIADNSLLPGSVGNVGALCGRNGPIRVQFLGTGASPMVEVSEGEYVPVSLLKGFYGVTVTSPDGSIIEETRALVLASGFHLTFGCMPPPPTEVAPGPLTDAFVVNTSGTCGEGKQVEFLLDGRSVGVVADGSEKPVRAPTGGVLVDVVSAGKRLLTFHLPRVEKGQSIVYGCTDPDAVSSSASGIPVAFQNTTDACEKPDERRHLTLWVDGLPKIGLPPGGKGVVKVSPGLHEFHVAVAATREIVMRGQKNVSQPFRIRWGCGN